MSIIISIFDFSVPVVLGCLASFVIWRLGCAVIEAAGSPWE